MGRAIAAATSGGTGVGPGASKYCLITGTPEPGCYRGPRRAARWSFGTPPWSIPRDASRAMVRLPASFAHCQGKASCLDAPARARIGRGEAPMAQTVQLRRIDTVENEAQRIFK